MDRIRRIELLVRAVDAGSFAKAAQSLDLTPSAVSHAITELEKQLGVALFNRTTRQLKLTEDGEGIYQRGCDILRQIAELESEAGRAPKSLSGTLRIGLPVALSRHIIMPRVPDFLRRHPNLRLEFHVLWQPAEMHAAGVDLLLRVGDPPDSNLVARKVAEIKPAAYTSPHYLKLADAPVHPDDLLEHRCLVLKVPWMNRPLDEWTFERAGERKVINVVPSLVTYDREGLIEAILAGGGVTWLGCFDPSLIASGQLRRLLPDWASDVRIPIYAMYRKSVDLPAKLFAFLEFVATAFVEFDPQELTLVHSKTFGDSLRQRRSQKSG